MPYDVLVIGTGPAGGSAALHAAQAGLNTIVVDEHSQVGEPVHCGECLSELATQRVGWKLPAEVISRTVKGVRVVYPGNEETVLTEPGVVLEKHLFEQWIICSAQEAGAELALGKKVTQVQKNDATWTVRCADDSIFESRVLVDASGVAGLCSRLLNMNARFESVIGIQYEMREIPTDGYIDFYLWPKLAPHGYLWMIPKSNGRANVGLVTNQNVKAKTFLDAFVGQKNWKEKTIVKTFGGLIPSSGPVVNTYGEGILLVGDAAGFTSPFFEGGSALSLMSGKLAAQVAKKGLDASDVSKTMFADYERLWRAEFPDYSRIITGKQALYNFSDEEVSTLGSLLPRELSDISLTQKIKFVARVLLHSPGLFRKRLLSVLQAFAYSRADHYGW